MIGSGWLMPKLFMKNNVLFVTEPILLYVQAGDTKAITSRGQRLVQMARSKMVQPMTVKKLLLTHVWILVILSVKQKKTALLINCHVSAVSSFTIGWVYSLLLSCNIATLCHKKSHYFLFCKKPHQKWADWIQFVHIYLACRMPRKFGILWRGR